MSPSLDGDERLELEYYREAFDDMGRRLSSLALENAMAKLNARPELTAEFVVEGLTKHVDKRVAALLADAVKNVVATSLLPRIEEVREATSALPALALRQMQLEARLDVALAELGLRA